jgi:hypothetical protein
LVACKTEGWLQERYAGGLVYMHGMQEGWLHMKYVGVVTGKVYWWDGFVTDGKSLSQLACPREWKKYEEENE